MDLLLAEAYAHGHGQGSRALLSRDRLAGAPEPLLLRALSAAAIGLIVVGLLTGTSWLFWLALVPAVGGTAAIAARLRARGDAMPASEEADRDLPTHTILIPLSRERPRTLSRLHLTLEGIDYPAHKLQGIAIVPSSDHVTRRRLRLHPLPAWVTVVEAPPSAARDRRGLLLFGLGLARGELLTAVRPGVPRRPRSPAPRRGRRPARRHRPAPPRRAPAAPGRGADLVRSSRSAAVTRAARRRTSERRTSVRRSDGGAHARRRAALRRRPQHVEALPRPRHERRAEADVRRARRPLARVAGVLLELVAALRPRRDRAGHGRQHAHARSGVSCSRGCSSSTSAACGGRTRRSSCRGCAWR